MKSYFGRGRAAALPVLAQNRIKPVMAQMNISLPDALKNWAEARVAEGRYSSTSDYVRDLMRRDQDHAEKRLQAAIDEGLASEETDATLESIIADARAKRRKA